MREYLININQESSGLFEIQMKYEETLLLSKEYRKKQFQSYQQIIEFIELFPFDEIILYKNTKNALIIDRVIQLLKERAQPVNLRVEEPIHEEEVVQDLPILNSLINGFKSFITGMYPPHFHQTKLKHIFLEIQNAMPHIATQLRLLQSSNINSSLIIQTNDQIHNPPNWFGIAQLQIQNKDNEYSVHIHTHNHIYKQRLTVLKLTDYLSEELIFPLTSEAIFVTVDTMDDFEVFSSLLKNAYFGGFMSIKEILPSVKDECMWAHKSMCSLRAGIRMAIGNEKKVIDSSVCYTVQSDQIITQTMNNLYEERYTKAFILANCNKCPVLHSCPSCVKMMPETELKERYCQIRQQHTFVSDYIKIRNILKSFINSRLNKLEISDIIEFSTREKKLFYQANHVQKLPVNYEKLFLFSMKDDIYMFINHNVKFYKINNLLAAILEGCILKESKEQIQAYMLKKFNFDKLTFNKLYTMAKKVCEEVGIRLEMK